MDSVHLTQFSEADDVPTTRITVAGGGKGAGRSASSPPETAQGAREERCAECGAPMAPDQRYCVECGERRGERRFPVAVGTDQASYSMQAPQSRRSRMSPSSTLIAGVGTLLLAMGVGVLIGRSGTGSSHGSGSGVQVVTVGGGGAAASAATGPTGTATPSGAAASKPSGKAASSGKAAIKPPKPSSLPPATVKVGSKGSGKGYKNGHFTGEFFGSEEG